MSQHNGRIAMSNREEVLCLWRQAQAVCFDVDCTVTKQDALDNLGEFLGVGDQIRALTNAAMDGAMDLDEALQKRLDIMEPTVEKLVAYAKNSPAEERLVPGIKRLIKELQARNVEVFLISGGFRELVLPVADLLEIPRSNIFANRFVYMADDTLGPEGYPQIRVRGFDPKEPTSHEMGKPEAIRRIREMNPYNTVVMVGDGITDLEAVQETGGADLFVGYGGVVERTYVKEHADWWITHHDELTDALPRLKVAMVGSGAWACAAMQMVSYNAKRKPLFENRVDMWVFEEDYEGGKLTDKMNELKENPKYLPGVKYGDNVVANPSLEDAVKDADLVIFCTPHQFVHGLCKKIQLVIKPTAFAISLIKGMHLSSDGPQLISAMIRRMIKIECSVLMGANIASEVKPGSLCEATIGAHFPEQGVFFKDLFDAPFFNVKVINDVEGAELAGTLKNIVALAAGFADGCELGENAKAAILRQGLEEMRMFAKVMFPTVRDETFFESCGVADLIATCYGGRNHMVAVEFAKYGGKKTFEDLERDLLNGQKLQGVLTSTEVQTVLERNGWEKQYPLFTAVNAIVQGLFRPQDIVRYRQLAASNSVKGRLTRSTRRLSVLEDKMGV
jgi:glycerol-3-phosphate dehydrogenase (NAD+)